MAGTLAAFTDSTSFANSAAEGSLASVEKDARAVPAILKP